MSDILMPKATAVWLVDNTSLTFDQIADFCGLHPLEVRGIADGEVARDIRGADPIGNGQLSREELDAALQPLGWKVSEFCRATGLHRNTPSRWRNEGVEIPAWVPKHLGLLLELQRLHAAYLVPPSTKGDD